jgi:tetratricopeptide (TPR) repeat protein
MKYESTEQGRLFGHTILYMADLLSMNQKNCISRYPFIEGWSVHSGIHPWPLGRRVAVLILHRYFIDQKVIEDLEEWIRKNAQMAYRFPEYLERGVIEFEQYIMIALVLAQEFEILERVLEEILQKYETPEGEAPSLMKNQNALPEYFKLYARYKLGKAGRKDLADIWAAAIDNYTSTFDDYQYLILLHWFLVDYHFSVGEADLSANIFRDALELSKFARYDLYTAWLLINDPQKDPDHRRTGEEMIRNSGMNVERFNFRFGTCPEPSESTTGSSR